MKMSTITTVLFRNSVIISCSLLLIATACKNNDLPATENQISSKQVNGKIPTKKDDPTKPSAVVVEVNGIKLTQNEVDARISRIMKAIKTQFPQDRIEEITLDLRGKIIDGFITRTVLAQEADKQNIVASDEEIKQVISKFEKNLPPGMTLEAAAKQGGMSMEEMRKDAAFSVRVNKLMDAQTKNDLAPSDQEIKNYYANNKVKFGTPETVHARHILIKVDDKDDEKTKDERMTKVKGIREQLLAGADFEKLAKEHSDCPSKEKGGDLGTFPRGRMAKPFEEAAFSQKANEIGPVVQTEFGNHIIQVLEHNQATEKKLDEVKDTIVTIMDAKKKQEFAASYITTLKEKAKIVYGTTDAPKK